MQQTMSSSAYVNSSETSILINKNEYTYITYEVQVQIWSSHNFNLEWLHKSFLYIASSLWNKLPVEIRQLNDQ